MRVADIALLYDYNYWAHDRILAQVARLTGEQYAADLGYSWGGVGGTLAHVLGTEIGWRDRWQGAQEVAPTPACPAAAELMARWAENAAAMRAYLATLQSDELERAFAYTRRGEHFSYPLWTQLAHVVNHGTQHRAEIAVMLTNYGYSPGDIDFSVFMRQGGR